jgi:hypothetical protein
MSKMRSVSRLRLAGETGVNRLKPFIVESHKKKAWGLENCPRPDTVVIAESDRG